MKMKRCTIQQDTTGCVIDKDRGTMMQVGMGRKFYPLDPRPEEVDIRDIARSLSRIIRYNGHSDIPISVAQHSINCSHLAWDDGEDLDMQRYMLLHDAAEAYTGDMIRPLKIVLPDFVGMETKVWSVIEEALNIQPVDMHTVRYYDNVACAWEKRDLFQSAGIWKGMPDIRGMNLKPIEPWPELTCYETFLRMYWEMT